LASAEAIIGTSSALTSLQGQETIVLVEDEAFVRKATAEALKSVGYSVLTAEGAISALRARCECPDPVDLLLADVVMPGTSGYELAREFRFLHPGIRILLMSGYAEQLNQSELPAYREEYMKKPFSIPTLLKRVRELLDGKPFDFGTSA
jgi:CheY-like chemotaxis protein